MMYLKFYSDPHFSAHYPSRASQLLRVKVIAMCYNVFHDLVQHLLFNLISSYLLIYSSFSYHPLNVSGIKLPGSLGPCALSKALNSFTSFVLSAKAFLSSYLMATQDFFFCLQSTFYSLSLESIP